MTKINLKQVDLKEAATVRAGALADRTSAKSLREEVIRLQAQRTRLRGEVIASAKRGQVEVMERRSLILARVCGRIEWCLSELIRLGAIDARPAPEIVTTVSLAYNRAEERRKAKELQAIAHADKNDPTLPMGPNGNSRID